MPLENSAKVWTSIVRNLRNLFSCSIHSFTFQSINCQHVPSYIAMPLCAVLCRKYQDFMFSANHFLWPSLVTNKPNCGTDRPSAPSVSTDKPFSATSYSYEYRVRTCHSIQRHPFVNFLSINEALQEIMALDHPHLHRHFMSRYFQHLYSIDIHFVETSTLFSDCLKKEMRNHTFKKAVSLQIFSMKSFNVL